mgnify:CR=1 FL=1
MVIAIVATALSVTGAQYVVQSGQRQSQADIQSDIRDMKTRMELRVEVDQARNELRANEIQSQNDAILELKRLTQLLQIQYSELSKQIAR